MIYSQGIPRQPRQGKPAPTAARKPRFLYSASPNEIQARSDLTRADKDVFAFIVSLTAASGGCCTLCNESLCELAHVSIRNLKRTLPKLERLGLIRRVMEGNRRVRIELTWRVGECQSGTVPMYSASLAPGGVPDRHPGGVPDRHSNDSGDERTIKLHAPLPEEDEDRPLSREESVRRLREMIHR